MRILHTSDWHLGRTFHGRVLDDAQAIFADHLVELARTEAVDAVVISGDVYDRAIPPTDSVLLLAWFSLPAITTPLSGSVSAPA